jgi:hypothetical protein
VQKSGAKVSRDLRIKSPGRIVSGVTVEPLPRAIHWVPPFRTALGPLVEQRPAGECDRATCALLSPATIIHTEDDEAIWCRCKACGFPVSGSSKRTADNRLSAQGVVLFAVARQSPQSGVSGASQIAGRYTARPLRPGASKPARRCDRKRGGAKSWSASNAAWWSPTGARTEVDGSKRQRTFTLD